MGVDETREVLENARGFSEVILTCRDENWGLAKSITAAVTMCMEDAGCAIVVEDDIVTSPAFLHYMNRALEAYRDNKHVWHISGYAEDYPEQRRGISALRYMNCWGWASWADRWANFKKEPDDLIASFSSQDIHRFNLDGAENFWAQVLMNKTGQINTWAIFWYASIFQRGGLCISPRHSYVENIGFDVAEKTA